MFRIVDSLAKLRLCSILSVCIPAYAALIEAKQCLKSLCNLHVSIDGFSDDSVFGLNQLYWSNDVRQSIVLDVCYTQWKRLAHANVVSDLAKQTAPLRTD